MSHRPPPRKGANISRLHPIHRNNRAHAPHQNPNTSFDLRVSWSGLTPATVRLTCAQGTNASATEITCGGSARASKEYVQGATLADIIAQTSGVTSPISGDLILHLGSADSPLANNINTSATSANHAFDIDGTVSGSMVSGNITVNNQTSVAAINKRVFAVAASSKFGLRVKAAGAVIVNNDGSINFTAGMTIWAQSMWHQERPAETPASPIVRDSDLSHHAPQTAAAGTKASKSFMPTAQPCL